MIQLVLLKKYVQDFYQKNSTVMNPLLKFVFMAFSLNAINNIIGYNPIMTKWYIVILISVICIVMPVSVNVFVASVYAAAHVFYVSNILTLILVVFFLICYFIYMHFDSYSGYIVLGVLIAHMFHVQFALPVIIGVLAAPVAFIPMSCGIFIYYLLSTLSSVISQSADESSIIYNQVILQLFSNKALYEEMLIFIMVIVVVYVIRNLKVNYAFEFAVFIGEFFLMTMYLIMNFIFNVDVNIVTFMIEIIVSFVLAYLVQFFKLSLNYAGVENLQFEDDDYYYYVKAVPKMNINVTERSVKRITSHSEADEDDLSIKDDEKFDESDENTEIADETTSFDDL